MAVQCERSAFRGPGQCPEAAMALTRRTYRADGHVTDTAMCAGHAAGTMKYCRNSWATATTVRLPLPADYQPAPRA